MMPEGPEVRTLVDQLQPGVGLRLCDLQVHIISHSSHFSFLDIHSFVVIFISPTPDKSPKVRLRQVYETWQTKRISDVTLAEING